MPVARRSSTAMDWARRSCALAVIGVVVAASCTQTSTSSEGASPFDSGESVATISTGSNVVSSPTSTQTSLTSTKATPDSKPTLTVAPPLTGWPAFDESLASILENGSSSVSATILRDGVVVHEMAIGARELAGDDAVAVGDRFRIASISKVITAITVLRLIDAGLGGLDDPVGARLATRAGVTAPSAMVDGITVRNLLTHRSGIGQYEDLVFSEQVGSCPQAAAVALTRPLARVPATTFGYSNVNFCLLGLLVEEWTGRPYTDVVQEQLLTPLGIDGMRFAATFDTADDTAVEHRSGPGRNYMEVLGAAGSWIASPTEIASILNSLDHETPGWKALTPATFESMRTITVDPPPPPAPPSTDPAATAPTTTVFRGPPLSGYGMGLMVFAPGSFGHTGTLESTTAMVVRRPDGITWAVTVSGEYPRSGRDLAPIVNEALGKTGLL